VRNFRVVACLLALGVLALAPAYLSAYELSLLGRFLALSILALGLTMTWGRTGILSLGQGVFFGLGGYFLAMHLKLMRLGAGEIPDFMEWTGLGYLPWWWKPFYSGAFSLATIILVPALLAGALAWLVFRRRVGGVYFAIITQALALAFSTLLISQQKYTGGFNGLTDFGDAFGFTLGDNGAQLGLYWLTLGVLAPAFAFSAWLLDTHFGKLLCAIRDGENRVRFLGYDPVPYKAAVFALGALFAAVAGALFTLHDGVISPAMVGVVPSIEMIIWVAVGGRESLAGAVLGTLVVNLCKDWVSSAMPELWLFAMGVLFIVVVTIFPRGLGGMLEGWLLPGAEGLLARFGDRKKRASRLGEAPPRGSQRAEMMKKSEVQQNA
jgi:urea transport system permease protein